MVRRNFAEIMEEGGFNAPVEFFRIAHLFYEFRHNYRPTIRESVAKYFSRYPIRGTALTLDDFDAEHGFFFSDLEKPTFDDLLTLCEYCKNLCSYYVVHGCQNHPPSEISLIYHQIRLVIKKIGYREVKYHGYYIYVEENPAAVSVAETLEGEIALETLHYNHHSMKGDLVAKRNTLAQMANWLEPKRGELKALDKELEGTLFFLFNRCSIRHNNEEEGNHFNPQMQNISKKELEEIYDDTYQLWLLAVLTLDNKERKAKYDTMKNESKALKN